MQKYSFESWLLGATVILGALILLPAQVHAADGATSDVIAAHPMKFGMAMLACYLAIKVAPSSRQHF